MRIISYPVSNENLNLDELMEKFEEEYEEFTIGVETFDYENILEEFYDIVQVMVNIMDMLEISTKDIESAYFKHHRKLLDRGWEFKK